MQTSIRQIAIAGASAVLVFASSPGFASETGDRKLEHISVDGVERAYVMSTPAARTARPTVLVLHGSLANAQMAAYGMGFEALARREDFLAVYPNAIAGQWNDGNAPAVAWGGNPPNDVAFLRALVAHLVRTGLTDPQRLYMTGFSSGGMMAFRLMCDAPELVAAIAPVAATVPGKVAQGCKSAQPTPALMINGTADPLVPFDGREVSFVGGRMPSNAEAIRFLRRINGCADTAQTDRLPDADPNDGTNVVVASWTKCSSSAPVVLYRVEGGGHRIPSRGEGLPFADMLLGRLNHDFDAPEVIWRFFKSRSRSRVATALNGLR